jgi:hypothetical protein
MDKILAFKVFCLEAYKSVHGLSGLAAYELFNKHKVFDYISSCYDSLHSNGKLYIVSDIDEYIAHRGEDTLE